MAQLLTNLFVAVFSLFPLETQTAQSSTFMATVGFSADTTSLEMPCPSCDSIFMAEMCPVRREQFKIFNAIVGPVSILVVNDLPTFQPTTDVLFHNKPMLEHVRPCLCGVRVKGHVEPNISVGSSESSLRLPAFPRPKTFSRIDSDSFQQFEDTGPVTVEFLSTRHQRHLSSDVKNDCAGDIDSHDGSSCTDKYTRRIAH